jgi:polyphenol oxidase
MQTAYGAALVCVPLEPLAPHFFTTREWTLGAAVAGDDSAAWDEVAAAIGVDRTHLVRVHQVHGATVVVCRAGSRSDQRSASRRPDADIIVSDDPTLALAIQTADCVSLLFGDRRSGAIAAAHAGWRGLAAGVPGVAVDALRREFGGNPADLVVAGGPSISGSRYEVGMDVRDRFAAGGSREQDRARWFRPAGRPDHWYFDAWQATRDQLVAAGVRPDHLHLADMCTASWPDVFCSYRRDGSPAGRLAAVIRRSTGAGRTTGRL